MRYADVIAMLVHSGAASPRPSATAEVDWTTLAALFYNVTELLISPEQAQGAYERLLRDDHAGDLAALRARAETLMGDYVQRVLARRVGERRERADGGAPHAAPEEAQHKTGRKRQRPVTAHVHASAGAGGDCAAASPWPGVADPTSPRHVPQASTAGSERGGPREVREGGSRSAALGADTEPVGCGPALGDGTARRPLGGFCAPAPAADAGGEADMDVMGAWVRGLPAEQRVRVQRLRYETALSPEVLTGLVQQFSCVEGADVFFAPVPAATIMEYNGVRSSSYHHIIRLPMSLMAVKKLIGDGRREYQALSGADQPGGALRGAGRMGQSSRAERIVTLAELERALWLIAANCVMFNAPETYYPYTARRFAAACTRILVQFCQGQLDAAA